jgi:hypothetical protein
MLFTYYFLGDKLDLTKFRKQANHYISTMSEITFSLYLPDYKINAEIAVAGHSNSHCVSLWINDLIRDSENEIVNSAIVVPLTDNRFMDIKMVQEIFPIDNYKALLTSNSIVKTVEDICQLTKLVFKINSLKVFI